ncbi:uncharacterized protein [Nicotiana sylvestris]|uniref:uncharacterized protein n=1 Tax=Nicotiana sylvestris TaxID=4096 RepID=UPI00388C48AA
MAYAALSSLMHTLQQLLQPNQRLVCGSCIPQQHVESTYQSLSALQVFLEEATEEAKDIETLMGLEKRIRDVVYKVEYRVDSRLRSVIVADCGDDRERACKAFNEELQEVEKEVDSLKEEVIQIEFNKHGSKSAELAQLLPHQEVSENYNERQVLLDIISISRDRTDESYETMSTNQLAEIVYKGLKRVGDF